MLSNCLRKGRESNMGDPFRKRIYCGTCLCGHSWEDHHLSFVMNPEALKTMGAYFPDECLFFGCNEDGGLDEDGNHHCGFYVDREDPVQAVKDGWKGTER